MQAALEAHNLLAERDARVLARLARVANELPAVVPLLPEDVHDLRGLHRVGRHLMQSHVRAGVSDPT